MSIKLNIINAETQDYSGSIMIEDKLVEYDCSHLLSKTIRVLNNNLRICRSSHYKCVSGIRGSSKKIRPQKRMGKSRQGELRNIHMKGGAVKFGYSGNKKRDSIRRYKRKLSINKKEKLLISQNVLKNKLINNLIYVIDFNNFKNKKTSKSLNLFKKFLNIDSRYTFVYDKNYNKSISNLNFLRIQNISSLNIIHILKNNYIIFDINSITKLLDKLKIKYLIK